MVGAGGNGLDWAGMMEEAQHDSYSFLGEIDRHTNALAYVPSTPNRGTGGFGSIDAAAA